MIFRLFNQDNSLHVCLQTTIFYRFGIVLEVSYIYQCLFLIVGIEHIETV